MPLSGAPLTWMRPLPSVTRSPASTSSSVGGDLEHHLARFPRRHHDGVADAVRAAAGEGAHAMRAGVGVGGVDHDVVVGHAERLGGDLRADRLDALAEIDGGQRDDEAAGGRGVDQRLARVAAEIHAGRIVDGGDAAPLQPGHLTPPVVIEDIAAKRGASCLAGLPRRRLDHLDQRRALDLLAVRLHVAVAIGVDEAELHRVHAEMARDLVHLQFQREIADRHAEAAHGGRRRAVGVDAVGVDMDVGDRIGPRHVGGRLGGAVGRVAAIGAGIDIERDLARDDAPVLHHAVLDVDALRGARRGHLHLLGAAVGVFHRPVGEHRAERGDRLDDHVDLAAEAAADRAADEAELVERHAEDQRHVVEREVERLRVGIDGDAAIALGLGRCSRSSRSAHARSATDS